MTNIIDFVGAYLIKEIRTEIAARNNIARLDEIVVGIENSILEIEASIAAAEVKEQK
jgi:hypothetical protein